MVPATPPPKKNFSYIILYAYFFRPFRPTKRFCRPPRRFSMPSSTLATALIPLSCPRWIRPRSACYFASFTRPKWSGSQRIKYARCFMQVRAFLNFILRSWFSRKEKNLNFQIRNSKIFELMDSKSKFFLENSDFRNRKYWKMIVFEIFWMFFILKNPHLRILCHKNLAQKSLFFS